MAGHMMRMDDKLGELSGSINELVKVIIRKEEQDKNLNEKVTLINHDVLEHESRIRQLELDNAGTKPIREGLMKIFWAVVTFVALAVVGVVVVSSKPVKAAEISQEVSNVDYR